MVEPVGTPVTVTHGDNIRRKGSVGYASIFLPTFGLPSTNVYQMVVFTRLGKSGKARLVALPVMKQVIDLQTLAPRKSKKDMLNRIDRYEGIVQGGLNKSQRWQPNLDVKIVALQKKPAYNLTDWHWVDFLAYVSARLIFLNTIISSYEIAVNGRVADIEQTSSISVIRWLRSRHPVVNFYELESIRDHMMHNPMLAASVLMKAIDKNGDYNWEVFNQIDITGPRFREFIMETLAESYALATPAIKFYDAYLEYYRSIVKDFAHHAIMKYLVSDGMIERIDKVEAKLGGKCKTKQGHLFLDYAIQVGRAACNEGRDKCKYVQMLPPEVNKAELISSDGMVRTHVFPNEPRFGGNRPQAPRLRRHVSRQRQPRQADEPQAVLVDDAF